MPIRTLPLSQISSETLREMQEREIPEGRTLDYKLECGLDSRSTLTHAGKLAFLADVTAMANAAGGTILYGAREGEGERRGRIVHLPGMEIDPDGLALSLAQVLRDSVAERLDGVEMHAIRVADGRYCLIVRVQASSLAPHMITARTHGPRFYVRGTVNNEPMDVRQIKEVAVRTQSAVERTRAILIDRQVYLARRLDRTPPHPDGQRWDAISVHLLPLDGGRGPDLTDHALLRHMQELAPAGSTEGSGFRRHIDLDGVANEGIRHDGLATRWTMLLRGGGAELVTFDRSFGEPQRRLDGQDVERQFTNALAQLRTLVTAGLLTLPALLSFRMDNVAGLPLIPTNARIPTSGVFDRPSIIIEPEVITAWEDIAPAATTMLNVLWQAAGFERSPYSSVEAAARANLI